MAGNCGKPKTFNTILIADDVAHSKRYRLHLMDKICGNTSVWVNVEYGKQLAKWCGCAVSYDNISFPFPHRPCMKIFDDKLI